MQKGSVNKVILVGHLGGDPESRFTPGGTAVATFSIATNESRKNSPVLVYLYYKLFLFDNY